MTYANPFPGTTSTSYLWVSPTGSDSNSGTQASPYKTIQAAIDAAKPGTAVMVEAGTYNENIWVHNSGTASAPIWLESADGAGQAHIVPVSSTSTIQGYGIHYLAIQGFDITGPHAAGGDNDAIKFAQNSLDFSQPNSYIAVTDNTIHMPSDGYCGIKISQTDHLSVLRNAIINPVAVGIDAGADQNSEIAYNYVSNTGTNNDFGIYTKMGSYNIAIHDNYVTGANFGIFLGQSSGTYYSWTGNPAGPRAWEASNANAWNNIVHDASSQGYSFQGAVSSSIYNSMAYHIGWMPVTALNDGVTQMSDGTQVQPLYSSNDIIHDSAFDTTNWFWADATDQNAVTSSNISTIRFLNGTSGNDTYTGGNAVITTGGGNDTIVMNKGAGITEITDFNPASDYITLNGYSFSSFADIQHAMSQAGPNVVLDLSDGHALFFDNVTTGQLSAANFGFPTPTPTPTPTNALSTIKVYVSEDAYLGDAQFTVFADGKQLGGTYSATTLHSTGQWQEIDITADMGAIGPSSVAVNFVNDAYGGSVLADRNLYVQGLDVNGHHFDGSAGVNTAGASAGVVADMWSNGSLTLATSGSPPTAATPLVSIGNASTTDGSPETFTLTLSQASATPVTVAYHTVDGTAHSSGLDTDFAAVTGGTATFAAGQTTTTLTIQTVDDHLANEPASTSFTVALDSAVGAAVSATPGVGTITDTDQQTVVAPFDLPVSGAWTNTINGTKHSTTLTGTGGNDYLDPRGGADTMYGGAGDDTYVVYKAQDIVVENAGQGVDTVILKASTAYTLPSNVENLTLSGNYAHTVTGNSLNNIITASSTGNDTITAGSGNDIIKVGTGADVLTAGAGHDMFVFSAVGVGSQITNFHVGQDLLDLRPLMKAAGYTGTDPVADHSLALVSDGAGGTEVMVDPTHSGTLHNLVELHTIAPGTLHVGADLLWY